jgi:hypothetical protein
MPKAKASSGDDILTTWGNLLANIQSVPTKSLLTQLANPIKLSADGDVISIKSELQVQQFTTGSKKAILQKAVEDLFGSAEIPITVRTPLPDDVIQKGNINIPKPNSAPKPQPQPQNISGSSEKGDINPIELQKDREKVYNFNDYSHQLDKNDYTDLLKQQQRDKYNQKRRDNRWQKSTDNMFKNRKDSDNRKLYNMKKDINDNNENDENLNF